MRKLLTGLALATTTALGAGGGAALAQSLVVVELYTSQGCSSCPAADRILTELASREDVIALGLHVDYWDYLGWRDDLAQPAFAKRQARFNSTMKSRYRLVTPQMIFDGQDYVAGAKPEKARAYIDMLAQEPEKAQLEARVADGAAHITLRPVAEGSVPADVHLVRYDPVVERKITRGENSGKEMLYTNVVTDWQTLARWDGRARLELSAPLSGDGAFAVIVQTENLGPVLAARKLD